MALTKSSDKKSSKVFVAFLDILGFSQFIKKNSHDVVLKFYQQFCEMIQISTAQTAQAAFQKPWFNLVPHNDGSQAVMANLDNTKINSFLMSDSIIFWTQSDSMKSFVELVATVKNFLICQFTIGFPVRGAITHGELNFITGALQASSVMIQHQLVGKSLVEAVELEGDQDWSGCIIHQDAIKKYSDNFELMRHQFNNLASLADLQGIGLIAKYLVPLKVGKKKEYVINWADKIKTMTDYQAVERVFSRHNKSLNDGVKLKIENTKQFILDMQLLSASKIREAEVKII
jgi:hypothetical protein